MKNRITSLLVCLLALCNAQWLRGATNIVTIRDYYFTPTNLSINVGDTVLWTNAVWPSRNHDTTRSNAPFSWTSPLLDGSPTTFPVTFTNSGFYPYYCKLHVYDVAPASRHLEQTGTVTVLSFNVSPSVSITNPANNARFVAPANVQLQASASDDGSVTNVQFFSG